MIQSFVIEKTKQDLVMSRKIERILKHERHNSDNIIYIIYIYHMLKKITRKLKDPAERAKHNAYVPDKLKYQLRG